jgi:hypothetical protein
MEHEHHDSTHDAHGAHDTHENKDEMRISGDDIIAFLRKTFQAGNSRTVIWKTDDNKTIFRINLIIFGLLCFILPLLALIVVITLIITNYSLVIEKRN